MSNLSPLDKARQMRDRERGTVRTPLTDPHDGTFKQREILFDHARTEQIEQARLLLSNLDGLQVAPGHRANALTVRYEITQFTLQSLETALIRQGFHLDNSIVHQLARAVIHFCEDTQLRNLRQPERLLKKSNEIYSRAWDQHPHGDHDDTPPELRREL